MDRVERLQGYVSEMAFLANAGFVSLDEAKERIGEAIHETFRPGAVSPRRAAALERLRAARVRLLAGTAVALAVARG